MQLRWTTFPPEQIGKRRTSHLTHWTRDSAGADGNVLLQKEVNFEKSEVLDCRDNPKVSSSDVSPSG
jgi:hypothetical protein